MDDCNNCKAHRELMLLQIAGNQKLRDEVETLTEGGNRITKSYEAVRAERDVALAKLEALEKQAQPEPVELTDGQIADIAERFEAADPSARFWLDFARAILAAAKGGV